MPQLSDLVEKRKFLKKNYRPWDLSGTGTVDIQHSEIQSNETILTEITTVQPVTIEEHSQIKEKVLIKTHTIPTIEKTSNITDNKWITSKQQTDNIKITTPKQLDNKQVTTGQQTDNNIGNITDNVTDISYLIESIKKLSGIQKNIFLYIINICTARDALDTGNILSLDIANDANCAIGTAKTSLNRLINKHLIVRYQGKACRGGHMVLGITKKIQAAAIQAQRALFNPLKPSNTDNITSNITGNNMPYSSSNIYNKTTTMLSDEWKKIDYESLISIGFSETQLCQLYQSNTTIPEIVQESINHFAFGLENNLKLKSYTDPLNVLMGVLRKGGNWIEKNYISPKEKALIQFLEQKKIESERIQLLENKILNEEYKIWITQLTNNEKNKILASIPKSSMLSKTLTDKANDGYILQYFKKHIYNKKD